MNVVFFMEEVQKYDCLYNKYSKSYKDRYIKINCWTKIGEKFDMSAADAEEKIENVRTGYGRYLKKVKAIPSGSGRDAVPTPKDFAGLEWLQKYISYRPTVSNMNPVEVDSDEDDNSVSEQGDTNKRTKIQPQRRSYGNTVSLPSLKTKILCQTRFSTTAATVATRAIIWKPGLMTNRPSAIFLLYHKRILGGVNIT